MYKLFTWAGSAFNVQAEDGTGSLRSTVITLGPHAAAMVEKELAASGSDWKVM